MTLWPSESPPRTSAPREFGRRPHAAAPLTVGDGRPFVPLCYLHPARPFRRSTNFAACSAESASTLMWPPAIRVRISGAETTMPSTTIARTRPTFRAVKSSKILAGLAASLMATWTRCLSNGSAMRDASSTSHASTTGRAATATDGPSFCGSEIPGSPFATTSRSSKTEDGPWLGASRATRDG